MAINSLPQTSGYQLAVQLPPDVLDKLMAQRAIEEQSQDRDSIEQLPSPEEEFVMPPEQ